MNEVIVGIDAGNKISGVAVVTNGSISYAENAPNERVMDMISRLNADTDNRITVIIEDIKPYSLKLGQSTIDTIKYIGELQYRLKAAKIAFKLIGRNEVKKWIFDNFNEICIARVEKKIEYLTKLRESKGEKGLRSANGDFRRPSFVFTDDRIVIAAMKENWLIPTPKPGKTNQYGLSAHSWQALAVASYYIHKGEEK